jgi:uncharacterized protein YndB with AHSA1/START domain
MSSHDGITLVARRTIRGSPTRLFEAWTEPRHLEQWWGPADVECVGAVVDLRVGGAYRIGNRYPDGRVVWITGVFEVIDRPHRLVYTWQIESPHATDALERVTVRFEPVGKETEVVVVHERIGDENARRGHEAGWIACLAGLSTYADAWVSS